MSQFYRFFPITEDPVSLNNNNNNGLTSASTTSSSIPPIKAILANVQCINERRAFTAPMPTITIIPSTSSNNNISSQIYTTPFGAARYEVNVQGTLDFNYNSSFVYDSDKERTGILVQANPNDLTAVAVTGSGTIVNLESGFHQLERIRVNGDSSRVSVSIVRNIELRIDTIGANVEIYNNENNNNNNISLLEIGGHGEVIKIRANVMRGSITGSSCIIQIDGSITDVLTVAGTGNTIYMNQIGGCQQIQLNNDGIGNKCLERTDMQIVERPNQCTGTCRVTCQPNCQRCDVQCPYSDSSGAANNNNNNNKIPTNYYYDDLDNIVMDIHHHAMLSLNQEETRNKFFGGEFDAETSKK